MREGVDFRKNLLFLDEAQSQKFLMWVVALQFDF